MFLKLVNVCLIFKKTGFSKHDGVFENGWGFLKMVGVLIKAWVFERARGFEKL